MDFGRFKYQFRLRDLFVLLLVAAVGTQLMIQWTLIARENARRSECQSRLKAIAVAANTFHLAFRAYPPAAPSRTMEAWHSTSIKNGQYCVGPNWACQILNFMDRFSLQRLIAKADDQGVCQFVDPGVLGNTLPDFMFFPSRERTAVQHSSSR
ncbi:MAG: DUF1559 domain-containing protein, partial [Planctomycetales bacterium]|nr:DUF1559 domain-containing protein [Planctomycetales bacterium]